MIILILISICITSVYSSCTPFVPCNETIYGSFINNQSVILLGRPMQQNDEIVISGYFTTNSTEEANFMLTFYRGAVLAQGLEENFLLSINAQSSSSQMNITEYFEESTIQKTVLVEKPNIKTNDEFIIRIKNGNGFGFVFGDEDSYTGKVPMQFSEKDRPQTLYFGGAVQTTGVYLRCRDVFDE